MTAYNTFVYLVGEDKDDCLPCYNAFVYLVGEDKDDCL